MKIALVIALFFLVSFGSFAQVKFNFRFSPGIASPRIKVSHDPSITNATNNGSSICYTLGASIDFHLSKRFAINTGLNYLNTQLNVHYTYSDEFVVPPSGYYDYQKTLQYLQIPITLKVFTNEIKERFKLYTQVGFTTNIKVKETTKGASGEGYYNDRFEADKNQKMISVVDAGIYFGVGVLYEIGKNELFGGIYYNRGLTNITNRNYSISYPSIAQIRMDVAGVEVGYRF